MDKPRRLATIGLWNAPFPVFSAGPVVYIRGLFHSAFGLGRGFGLPAKWGVG